MRTVVAIIEVDDERAIAEDMGTLGYLEQEFGWLEASGITLYGARILDDDDKEDVRVIELVNEVFDENLGR